MRLFVTRQEESNLPNPLNCLFLSELDNRGNMNDRAGVVLHRLIQALLKVMNVPVVNYSVFDVETSVLKEVCKGLKWIAIS